MGIGAFEQAEEILFIADDVAGIRIGNENSEADGLFGVLGRVVHGPIGAPTCEENAVLQIDDTRITSSLGGDGLDAGTETGEGVGERHIATEIAVAG